MEMLVKLRPWRVPNFVTQEAPIRERQDGFSESPTVSIKDVPAQTLAAMCDEFRQEVFSKAGKADLTTI